MEAEEMAEAQEGKSRTRGRGLNRVELIGRLTKDPDVRATEEGQHITTIRLTTNEGSEPEYHDLVAFGKTAELAGEHLRKGRLLFVMGRLRTRTYEDHEGSKRQGTQIVVNRLLMLDGRG
jgi:single-strand DNA-binding protein